MTVMAVYIALMGCGWYLAYRYVPGPSFVQGAALGAAWGHWTFAAVLAALLASGLVPA